MGFNKFMAEGSRSELHRLWACGLRGLGATGIKDVRLRVSG